MERYKNLGGRSNVSFYEIEGDSIKVAFKDGSLYLYNNLRPGIMQVSLLKRLAVSGLGLNSYISKEIRKNYAAKLR